MKSQFIFWIAIFFMQIPNKIHLSLPKNFSKMKLIKLIALIFCVSMSMQVQAQKKKIMLKNLKTQEQQASYALGAEMGKNILGQIKQYGIQFEDLDTNIIKASLLEYLQSGKSQMDSATAQKTLADFSKNMMEKQKEKEAAKGKENEAAGQQYIQDQMKANPKLIQTASGLVYEVIKEGTGKKPTAQNTVAAKYKGMLIDGTVFDDSKGKAIEFPLSGVIKGWTEGLQLMSEGAVYRFIIPADLAYGNQSRPPHIQPGATLVFEVELVQVK